MKKPIAAILLTVILIFTGVWLHALSECDALT